MKRASAAAAMGIVLAAGRAHADDKDAARAKVVDALVANDAKALRTAVAVPFQISRIWFADATCAKRFSTPKPTNVTDADVPAFVACLHGAGIARVPDAGSIDALVYPPGTHLDVLVYPRTGLLPALVMTGRAPATAAGVTGPLMQPETMESHRMTGTAAFEPDSATKTAVAGDPKAVAYVAVTYCVGATGKVISTEVVARSKAYDAYVASVKAQVAAWTFKAFQPADKALTVCSTVSAQYPADRTIPLEAAGWGDNETPDPNDPNANLPPPPPAGAKPRVRDLIKPKKNP